MASLAALLLDLQYQNRLDDHSWKFQMTVLTGAIDARKKTDTPIGYTYKLSSLTSLTMTPLFIDSEV